MVPYEVRKISHTSVRYRVQTEMTLTHHLAPRRMFALLAMPLLTD